MRIGNTIELINAYSTPVAHSCTCKLSSFKAYMYTYIIYIYIYIYIQCIHTHAVRTLASPHWEQIVTEAVAVSLEL